MRNAAKGSRQYKGHRYSDTLVRNVLSGDVIAVGGEWHVVTSVYVFGPTTKGVHYRIELRDREPIERRGINTVRRSLGEA